MSRIDKIRQLLALDPQDAELHFALGMELANGGQHEAAVLAFQACIRLQPGQHYAYFQCARCWDALDDQDKALEVLDAGLHQAQDDRAGKALAELSELRRAIATSA